MKSIKALALLVLLAFPLSLFANATIVIVNNDPAGVGFNVYRGGTRVPVDCDVAQALHGVPYRWPM